MAKCLIAMSFHGLVVVGTIALALWVTGTNAVTTADTRAGAAANARADAVKNARAGAVRYDTATPYAPPHNRYKYIPIHDDRNNEDLLPDVTEQAPESSGMPVPELILTALRTALDVVRGINRRRANATLLHTTSPNNTAIQLRRTKVKGANGKGVPGVSGRGFEDYYDEHHEVETTTTAKPMKGRYTDPWAGYYDWIINEGSFKFWSVFQLFTAALLLYACFSAIYYAKFNPILPDYNMEYDDYFLERTVGRKVRSLDAAEMPSGLSWINPTTFQFILDAISRHYEDS